MVGSPQRPLRSGFGMEFMVSHKSGKAGVQEPGESPEARIRFHSVQWAEDLDRKDGFVKMGKRCTLQISDENLS